jgi:hypothetical protein
MQPRLRDYGCKFLSTCKLESLISTKRMFGDSSICALEIIQISGDLCHAFFRVLLVTCHNSSWNSRSVPCLNFRRRSWMVAFTAWLGCLRSEDLSIEKSTNCLKSIWSCRMGHGSNSVLLSQVGCACDLRDSLVASNCIKECFSNALF